MPEEIYNVQLNTAEAEAGLARLITLIEQAQAKVVQLSSTPITTTGAGGEAVPTQFAQFKEQLSSFQQDATRYQGIVQQISAQGGRATPVQAQQFTALSASITEATQRLQGYVSLSERQLAQPAGPVPIQPVEPIRPVAATVTTAGAEAATQAAQRQAQADAQVAQQTTTTTAALEQEAVAEQQVAQGALQAAQAKDQLAQAEQRVATAVKTTPTPPAGQVAPLTPVTPPVAPVEPQVIPVTADATAAKAEIETTQEMAARPIPPQTIVADSTQLKEAGVDATKLEAQLQQAGAKPIVVQADSTQIKKATADAEALEQQTKKQYQVQERIYQSTAQGQMKPVVTQTTVVDSLEEARRLKAEAEASGRFAGIKEITPTPQQLPLETTEATAKVQTLKGDVATIGTVPQEVKLDTTRATAAEQALKEKVATPPQPIQQEVSVTGLEKVQQAKSELATPSPPVQQAVTVEGLEQAKASAQETRQSLVAISQTPIAPDTTPAITGMQALEAEAAKIQQDATAISGTPIAPDLTKAQADATAYDQWLLKIKQDQEQVNATPIAPVTPTPTQPAPAVTPITEQPSFDAAAQSAQNLAAAEAQAQVGKEQLAQPSQVGLDTTKTEAGLQNLIALQEQAKAKAAELQATGTPRVGFGAEGVAGGAKSTQFSDLNKDIDQINASLPKAQAMMAQLGQGQLPTDQWVRLNNFIDQSNAKLEQYLQLKNQAFAQPAGVITRAPPVPQPPPVAPVQPPVAPLPVEIPTENLKNLGADATAGAAGLGQLSANAQMASTLFSQLNQDVGMTRNALISMGFSGEQASAFMKEAGLPEYRKNLSDLQKDVRDTKASLDGSLPSQEKYKNALAALAPVANQAKVAEQELTQAQRGLADSAEKSGVAYGSLTNLIERQVTRIAVGLAIWTTFRAVTNTINEQITALREYELETARFAAITGQALGEARQQWDKLAQVAVQQGVTPMGAAQTIRIAVQMEGTEEAKQKFVETVTKLEELTGVSSDKISKSISSALRQAGKGLEAAPDIGDLIASSLQRIPASNLESVVAALSEAPALARLWGTSFEEAFNIIIEGASRVQESPEAIATSFQRLSQGLNDIAQGGEKAFERKEALRAFGIEVEGADKRLRPIPEILRDVAKILPTLSAPRQQALLEVVAGGNVRPEQLRNLIGGLEAFTVDLSTVIEKLDGTLQKMVDIVDGNLGQVVKVMDARIAQVREKSDLLSNLMVSFLRGTVGQYGGKPGAEIVMAATEVSLMPEQAKTQKQGFLENIVKESMGDWERAKQLMDERNQLVRSATDKQKESLNVVQQGAAEQYAQQLMIYDDELAEALKSGGTLIAQAAQERAASLGQAATAIQESYYMLLTPQRGAQAPDLLALRMMEEDKKVAEAIRATGQQGEPTQQQQQLQRPPAQTPMQYLAEKARTVTFAQPEPGQKTGELLGTSFFTQAPEVDARKYTQDQINQAKMISLQLAQQELEAIRAQAEALGFNVTQIDAIIAKRREELGTQMVLLRTQQGTKFEVGFDPRFLQEGLRHIDEMSQKAKQAKKEMESAFSFQRLDIGAEQFPQLQALAQMYDALLQRLGSPEKQTNANLLLNDNTFKTMNVRLSALQMAMEDLTKVEKAQLSGTWNLPSGATAMVPISSLDIQRWNQPEGAGGVEGVMAAIAELLKTLPEKPVTGGEGEGGGYYPVTTPEKETKPVTPIPPSAGQEYKTYIPIVARGEAPSQQRTAVPIAPTQIASDLVTSLTSIFKGGIFQPPTTALSQRQSSMDWPTTARQSMLEGARREPQSGADIANLVTNRIVASLPRVGGGFGGAVTTGGGGGAGMPARAGVEGMRREPVMLDRGVFSETNRILAGILQAVQKPEIRDTRVAPTERARTTQQEARTPTTTQSPLNALAQALTAMSNSLASMRQPSLAERRAQPTGGGALGDISSVLRTAARQADRAVNVQVSMLPIRATFNANLTVMLNGQAIARALQPILYQMLTRAVRGSGSGTNSIGRIR